MLTYHLKPHNQQPLYEQLYHAVRADIMSGALPGGTRLPSKRQLAANLRVSQITVETAYGQLAAEGKRNWRNGLSSPATARDEGRRILFAGGQNGFSTDCFRWD